MENGNGTAPVHDPASAPGEPGRRALVVGAGIGGLTVAAGLADRGWHVTVLERSASLEPVGAAISLAPNGQRALDRVGVGNAVRALAAWQGSGGLRAPDGRWLARTTSEEAGERYGDSLVLLHRATLIDLLRARLPEDAVRTGSAAEVVDPGAADDPRRPARVRTATGELAADLVVAADGIGSATRRRLFPGHPGPVYAGFTTWRLMVPAPAEPFPPHETWGRGTLWGSQPLHDGTVYAYAAAAVPEGGRAADDERAELLRRFGDWHHPVPALLAAADPHAILRHDVRHMRRPLPAHHRGRVALLGDAAHAMAPSRGQGGNQAIEDGVVLAHHLAPGTPPGPGLAAYSADRLPRTSAVVARAAKAGALTTLRSPLAVRARDALVATASRLGPDLVLRSFAGITDWRPPQRAYAASARGVRPEGDRGRDAGSGT
ncbi:monooxygenase [Streptomyces diastaticus subsp. diastaticus]|uniref:Monooxygenase n=1 Tax=Streptomyces diastaticus subsp. diastaticus TaxID=68040 RepID=A0ABN2VNB7_STRDI|nr:FAD-dependent monooxygenase [Streptomyces diastaticus]GFH72199.1 monooxygenase [Streptomyces diastaticus subsp. diastaticus]GGU26488.1 monooxygenase [Streptomyces diastaticus subsp. diastaticus]